MLRWAVLILVVPSYGQTLKLSSIVAKPGPATMIVSLESPAGKAPAALQWDVTLPVRQVSISGLQSLAAGSAAISSGKSLSCAGRWKKEPELYTYRCILAGGRDVIKNGPVAVLKVDVHKRASARTANVELERVQAVSADAREIPITAGSGRIDVR